MIKDDFYTFNEYMKKEDSTLTASMEDYLEMIYRLYLKKGYLRVHELSSALNVQPPSATRMVQKLAELKLLKYEKYGIIILEEKGRVLGETLLNRHNIIESFLKMLEVPDSEILDETEKIEHTISKQTARCFQDFVEFMKRNPDIVKEFESYKKSLK
ncbi:transcriptional regulator MntR [Clostridium chromiireducens]|uniref:Manganese transport regulator n=1 Tax=Clostridium chromiireducens TaxID=225345 RepID=A0A399IRX3_9CLOT|nr:transcriptional regulator MntR [Clostridium chromiireducens]RII35803.1 transcriptional regulator MntR [Clostridium chromiireducens]